MSTSHHSGRERTIAISRNRPTEAKLLRALVEVGLIFFGITLALGFENRNAERVDRAKEQELLTALAGDLEETLADLRRDIADARAGVERLRTLVEWQDGRAVPDSLLPGLFGRMGGNSHLFAKVSAYESLKTIGLDLISDGEVRSRVTSLHELSLERVSLFEKFRDDDHRDVVLPFIRSNFRYVGEPGFTGREWQAGTYEEAPVDALLPVEGVSIRSDPEFRLIVRNRFNGESIVLLGYRNLEAELQEVIELVRGEIES